MNEISNYIDGMFTGSLSGKYLDNYNPAEGKVYSLIPDSDAGDVSNAVNAARNAFPEWSSMSAEKRSTILLRIADLIDRDIEKLSLAESVDNGKPVKQARSLDIPRAAANIRFYATAAIHFASEAHITGVDAIN